MKDRIVLLIASCFALILSSCLGEGQSYEYQLSKDAQVYQFHLKSDSVPKLDSMKFSIDQLEGLIYNNDSMPFGTVIKDKVLCTFNTKGVIGIQVIQEALMDQKEEDGTEKNDTIWWNTIDSLDFSKPVWFITHAQDGVTTKKYKAWINIHQVVPDSMVWELYSDPMINSSFTEQTVMVSEDSTQYIMYAKEGNRFAAYTSYSDAPRNWRTTTLVGFPDNALVKQMVKYDGDLVVPTADGKLYKSDNYMHWTQVAGTPAIAAVLGVVNQYKYRVENPAGSGKYETVWKPLLAVIVKNGAEYRFARLVSSEWKEGDVLDSQYQNFPLSAFGALSYNVMFEESMLVAAGRTLNGTLTNTIWRSSDGMQWVSNETTVFDKREGSMLTAYDDKLFLIGGLDEKGVAKNDIYTSRNYGVVWAPIDSMKILPKEYKARAFSSVQVNKEKFLFLFGGKEANNKTSLNQIWRGRINRLGFKD